MDYDKTSDFDDVAGHWHVEDHPAKVGTSRVFYACDIKMKGTVPKPILSYISKAALKQATGWVKRESEEHPDAMPPAKIVGEKAASAAAAAAAAPAKLMSFGRRK